MIPERRPTRLPVPIARALSKLYELGIDRQNRKYDQGIGVTTLDRPVISVGNLSAGGTGKTPLVQHIVRTLQAHNHHPVIAMRGYKAQKGELGDEAHEHLDALGDLPIVAQPDRIAGLRALFATDKGKAVDVVVLDDGFQHRKIARDLDIVVIDSTNPPTNDALLPLGFLRERMDSLSRADLVVLTHTDRVSDLETLEHNLRRWIPSTSPIIHSCHTWRDLRVEEDSEPVRAAPLDELRGEQVLAVCGIGTPDPFLRTLESHGAERTETIIRKDHEPYSEHDIDSILRTAQRAGLKTLVTTRKDRARMGDRADRILRSDGGFRVITPTLELGILRGEHELLEALKRVCPGS